MNQIQRSVLKQHFRQLAHDIILTDTLLGAMYQAHIFERNMIDLIKAERTEENKVCKMLEMLPKRGPDAFDSFIDIIQSDYPWLAAMLTSSIKHETLAKDKTKTDIKLENVDSVRTSVDLSNIDADMDIKTKVGTFIHKQFGQSKRISENDKKTMIRWISHTLHDDRRRQLASASSTSVKCLESISISMEDKCCGTQESNDNLQGNENAKLLDLYQKMQEFKKERQICPESRQRNESTMSCDSLSSENPKSTNQKRNKSLTTGQMDLLLTDVQHLMDKVEEMESEMNKCYLMLGDRSKSLSLSLLIYDMSISTKQKEKDLKQEKQKSEKMLTELYEYSKQVTRLELTKTQHESSVISQMHEINELKEEIEQYKEQITKLESLNKLHTEKQRTLENLKSMVRDLQNNNNPTTARSSGGLNRSLIESYGKPTTGSRQVRYGVQKTKGEGDLGIQQPSAAKKYGQNKVYKRKNNPSTYKY